MNKTSTRVVSASACVAIVLSGCAAAPRQGAGGVGQQAADPCDTATTALAGALVGALIGGASGKGRNAAAGAAVGGAIGALACIAINNQSRQVRSAAAVEQDFTSRGRRLPPQPQLVSYQTRIDPSGTVRSNAEVTVTTNVEVVRGMNVPVQEVKEEIVLYDTQNKEFKRASKVLNQGAGGAFDTQWRFKLPSGVTQGRYLVQTNMYVNGQQMAQRETAVQLVMLDQQIHVASAAP